MIRNKSYRHNHLDLFYELARTDFILRYNNSLLGIIWVLLKPILMFAVIFFVFSLIFKSKDPHYRYNLFLGIILFSFFSEATQRGITCLQEKARIILKLNFPKFLAIYTSTFNSFISFIFSMLAYLFFWIFTKDSNTQLHLIYFSFQILILIMLITGINFFISIIYPKFRDLHNIWEILLKLLFYFTPVIYPLTVIPEHLQTIFLLNPLAVIISESRKALITNDPFSWQQTLYVFFLAVILLIAGFIFFQKNVKKIAENL
ncbi:ABC transporter permease [Patescibacteria group bacterium]